MAADAILDLIRLGDVELSVAYLIGILVYFDATVAHPSIWNNQPALTYFALKIFAVGIPLYITARTLRMTGATLHYSLHLGIFAGLVVLQGIYGYYPVPLVGGEAVQVSLVPSLVQGIIVHGGIMWAALTPLGIHQFIEY